MKAVADTLAVARSNLIELRRAKSRRHRPSIWMTKRSSWDRSDAIHSASRSADSATNRRDAADFEVSFADSTPRA
jgi:hypothetical protein